MITNCTEIFNNDFGFSFQRSSMTIDGIHFQYVYKCMTCGKEFISKTGAKSHRCLLAIQKQNTEKSIEMHRLAFENILRFIASSDIAFNAIDNDFLRNAFRIFDDTFILPGRDKLKGEMKKLSEDIHNQMLSEISGKTVSLLYDSCHRWAEEYQGVIIFTKKRLYLWGLINTDDSKASTIADTLSSIVNSLQENSTTVVSICCDNCRSNVKAMDGNEDSAQGKSENPFIREPCSAHTANLGIGDLFSKGMKYHYIKKAIKVLLSNKPEGSYRSGFSPKLKTIRWQSLYECTCFITDNYQLYAQSQENDVINSINIFNGQLGWIELLEVLEIMWIFIQEVERDLSSIDQIVQPYFKAHSKLIEKNTEISFDMANALQNRFLYTCPLQLPLLAFF